MQNIIFEASRPSENLQFMASNLNSLVAIKIFISNLFLLLSAEQISLSPHLSERKSESQNFLHFEIVTLFEAMEERKTEDFSEEEKDGKNWFSNQKLKNCDKYFKYDKYDNYPLLR